MAETDTDLDRQAELIAAHWRRISNRLANASYDWTAWEDLSEPARATLTATARGMLEAEIIAPGSSLLGGIEEVQDA